jgi:hypothetical protein
VHDGLLLVKGALVGAFVAGAPPRAPPVVGL